MRNRNQLTGIFFMVLLIVAQMACNGGERSKAPLAEPGRQSAQSAADGNNGSYYKRLEGTVGDGRVIVHLSKFDDLIRANYYYIDAGEPVQLFYYNNNPAPADSIELTEWNLHLPNAQEEEARWRLRLTATGAKGSRINARTGIRQPVVLEEKYPDGAYIFNVIGYKDSLLLPMAKDTVKALSAEMLLEPADAALAGNWFKNGLLKSIWADSSGSSTLSLAQLLKENGKDFINEYRAEIDTLRQLGHLPDSGRFFSLNYENQMSANLLYNDNNFIVMDVSLYSYRGGAHGLEGSSMICYDVSRKQLLEPEDVLRIDSATMQKIITRQFGRRYGLRRNEGPGKMLFEDKPEANDNFYFTQKGIGFVYQPYEIAAYAYGIIDIFIPFSELKDYLNPAFAQRMGLE